MAKGVNGIGIMVAAVGSLFVYSGFRNVTPLDALRTITKGGPAPVGQQTPGGTGVSHGGDSPAVIERRASGGGTDMKAVLVAFGRGAQQGGYKVTEHPDFGGVAPVHTPGSKHYSRGAIDINHGAGTSTLEQAALARLVPLAHSAGLTTIFMSPGHYNHLHVQVP